MTTPPTTSPSTTEAAIEDLTGRLFDASVAAIQMSTVYLGHHFGLYRTLASASGLTSAELATRAGLDERYTREWLQSQVISGLVTADDPDLATARFRLATGVREVLVDELSPTYLAPLAQCTAAVGRVMPELIDAYRSGAGVPYAAYGDDAVSAQAALNRPAFANDLVPTWLPAMPSVVRRLTDTRRPARVADVGCGAGWSTIALAQAFPHLRIVGYDIDETSIAMARHNAIEHGVADRVTFEVRDVAVADPDMPAYDMTFLFECLHDMAYPEAVLRNVGAWLAEDGEIIVMDERTDEELIAPSDDPVQRFYGSVSAVWCLPQGRTSPDADPVGTVMRPGRLRQLAAGAGFGQVEIAPIEHPFWRFYRLTR